MKAADVMVTNVISIGPNASLQDVARTLLTNRISAVPVVDADGKLLGIVSEGDLMRRVDGGIGRPRSWWLTLLVTQRELAAEYVKEHSRKVADVMTRNVVTAARETPLQEIATFLEQKGIKRVPIVEEGKVVGIVSRANLVQALASAGQPTGTPNDFDLRNSVIMRLEAESWARPCLLNVIVHDGKVDLWGTVESDIENKAVRVAVESTPGVRGVKDNLIIRSVDP
jgi:CBS domain-containing protein